MEQLKNKISIYVPSTIDGNKPAKLMQRREAKRTAKFFCSLYGGATTTNANGYYISNEKGLIKERQIIVYSFCDDMHENGILAFAKRLCKRMKQESIAVEFNNKMIFIEA